MSEVTEEPIDWRALDLKLCRIIGGLTAEERTYPGGGLTRRAGSLMGLLARVRRGERSEMLAFQIGELREDA